MRQSSHTPPGPHLALSSLYLHNAFTHVLIGIHEFAIFDTESRPEACEVVVVCEIGVGKAIANCMYGRFGDACAFHREQHDTMIFDGHPCHRRICDLMNTYEDKCAKFGDLVDLTERDHHDVGQRLASGEVELLEVIAAAEGSDASSAYAFTAAEDYDTQRAAVVGESGDLYICMYNKSIQAD